MIYQSGKILENSSCKQRLLNVYTCEKIMAVYITEGKDSP